MKSANLVFPHQLLQDSPLLKNDFPFFMVEEYLFFKQYAFHKQKIAFHRSTMKYYEAFLRKQGRSVHYVDSYNDNSDIRDLILYLKKNGVTHIHFIDPVDNWLENHLIMACQGSKITYTRHDSPLFLNSKEELSSFFRTDKKKYHQTSFYIE
ncbi:MAG: cryptochrome/photolyase family protein [Bacteroidota bacterium]